MQPEIIRICVLGDEGVGKSSLTLQFTQSHFPVDFDPSIEDIYKKDLTIKDKPYELHILDTAVQDDYSPLKEVQLEQADGFVLVYKVTSIESMGSATNNYRHIMRIQGEIPPCILIGNQADLENERLVTSLEGEEIVQELELSKYFETSAKNDQNVKEAFQYLAEQIVEKKEEDAMKAKLAEENLQKKLQEEEKEKEEEEQESKKASLIHFKESSEKNDNSKDTLSSTVPGTLKSLGTSSEETTSTMNMNRRQTFTIGNSSIQKESVEVLESTSRGTPIHQRSQQSTSQLLDEKADGGKKNKEKSDTCCIIM